MKRSAMSGCTVTNEDLIAYDDGYLAGGRRELVEAHLATGCPSCQRRLAEFREVTRIIQRSAPEIDPRRVQRVRRGVRRKLNQNPRDHRMARMVRPMLASVALGLLILAFAPVSNAGTLLGEFVRFGKVVPLPSGIGGSNTAITPVATAPPGVGLSFAGVEPDVLPLALVRTERSVPNPERLAVVYRNESGLEITVIQIPATPGALVMDPDNGTFVVPIGSMNVLVLPGPWPESALALFWERDGVAFSMSVTEATGLFPLADAIQVASALIKDRRD